MNEQGLAGVGQAPQINADMLEQAMAMLSQGASPEELMQMGIPPEVIEAAMAELSAQAQAQAQQPMQPPMGGGLASQQMA